MPLPQLKIDFVNATDDLSADNDEFLYLSTANKGQFTITSNVDATFTSVEDPPPLSNDNNFDPSGSVIYLLNLDSILTETAIAGMQFDNGWNAHQFTDENGSYWALSPKAQFTVKAGKQAKVTVENVVVGDVQNLPGTTLSGMYYNVDGVTQFENHADWKFYVALRASQNKPPKPNLSQALSCGFIDGFERDSQTEYIRITDEDAASQVNSFSVQFTPISDHDVPVASTDTRLSISFPVADGPYGAFASIQDLSKIIITPEDSLIAQDWQVISHADGPQPFWDVIPVGPISGKLNFTNVVTHLEIGASELAVQYSKVPGYEDGHFSLTIMKYDVTPVFNRGDASGIIEPQPHSGDYIQYWEYWGTGSYSCDNIYKMDANAIRSRDGYICNSSTSSSWEDGFSFSGEWLADISAAPDMISFVVTTLDPNPDKRQSYEIKRISIQGM